MLPQVYRRPLIFKKITEFYSNFLLNILPLNLNIILDQLVFKKRTLLLISHLLSPLLNLLINTKICFQILYSNMMLA